MCEELVMTFEEWWEQVEAYGLGLPEGYVLVPVEPTEEIVESIMRRTNYYTSKSAVALYEAMLQAAQESE